MRTASETPSIRRRLLALLLIPTAAVAAAATYSAYRTSLAPLDAAYDAELRDTALAVASSIEARGGSGAMWSLTPDAVRMLRSDAHDTIYYRVSGSDGHFIAGDRDLAVPHQAMSNPEFSGADYRGEPIRVVSYRIAAAGGAAIVTVAETLHKRQAARRQVLRTSLAVDAAQLAIALAVIWLGVRFAIEPLREAERQLAMRRPRELAPLATASVPVEIRSLIDALNHLFRSLQDSQLAERSFIENAAHQLRTPLAGMLAHLELMASGDTPDLARAHAALEGARRLAHTTQQLLALARSDAAARAGSDIETLSLPGVVEACVESRLAAADAAGIDLGAQIDPVATRGLGWMLGEALGNLTDNAIAATPAGGSVTLRCGHERGCAFLEVSDTGIGIPPAERAQVFERFYRASNARAPGSGLGLAIVREVARLHGATLTLDPGDGGKGTCVRMSFPPGKRHSWRECVDYPGAGIPSAFATNPN